MIPKKYLRPDKRMKWEYIWDENGRLRKHIIAQGFETYDLDTLLDHLLPNKIVPNFTMSMFDDRQSSDELDRWIRQNINHPWQLWMVNGELRRPVFYFESVSDALLFKLRWA